MPLTLAQHRTPFRAVGTRSAPYSNVLERSLYLGSAHEWAHWETSGILLHALSSDAHRLGVLRSLAKGWATGRVPLERLERAWVLAGDAAWENRRWVRPLLDAPKPDGLASAARAHPALIRMRLTKGSSSLPADMWEQVLLRAIQGPSSQGEAWARLACDWLPAAQAADRSAWLATAVHVALESSAGHAKAVSDVAQTCVNQLLADGARADGSTQALSHGPTAWGVWWDHHTRAWPKPFSPEGLALGRALLRSGGDAGLSLTPSTIFDTLHERHTDVLAAVLPEFCAAVADPWAESFPKNFGHTVRHALDEALWPVSVYRSFAQRGDAADRSVFWLTQLGERAEGPPEAWVQQAVINWARHMGEWLRNDGVPLSETEKHRWTKTFAQAVLAWAPLFQHIHENNPSGPLPYIFGVCSKSVRQKSWIATEAWATWAGHEEKILRLLEQSMGGRSNGRQWNIEWLVGSLMDPKAALQLLPFAARWSGWWWEAALAMTAAEVNEDEQRGGMIRRLLTERPLHLISLPIAGRTALAAALASPPWQSFALEQKQDWGEENLWVFALEDVSEALSFPARADAYWREAWSRAKALHEHGYALAPPHGASLLEQCMALPYFPVDVARELVSWGADPGNLPEHLLHGIGAPGHAWVVAQWQEGRLEKRLAKPRDAAGSRPRM